MLDRNNSKIIRDYVMEQFNLINNLDNNLTFEDKAQILFDSMDNFENDNYLHYLISPSVIDKIDFEAYRIITILSRIQMYTDYYMSSKLQDKLIGSYELINFPKVDSYDKLKEVSSDKENRIKMLNKIKMLESLKEYYNSSGFDKVLYAKCLDKKDVNHLKAINPFFEYEYNSSNVEINLDFMIKHIEKWQKSYQDDIDLSYLMASNFVFDLYKIKREEAENLLINLFKQDLGIISSTNLDDDDEYIKIGQVNMNIQNLAIMFKDYHKFQNKILKKR